MLKFTSIPPLPLHRRSYRRLMIGLMFSLGLFFSLLDPVFAQTAPSVPWFNPQHWLQASLTWIDGLGPTAAIAFIGLYALATIALFPGSILTIGGGILFGVVWGSIYVFVGATLGATGAFLVGRYLARDWVKLKIEQYPKFKAIDQAVKREGLKIAILTRLSPVFPFVFLNYAYGITGVSVRDYVWGCVGMIPGTVLYVYLGSLAGDLANLGTEAQTGNPWLQWAVRLLGFVATVGVSIYVTKIARQALAAEIAPDPAIDE